MQVTRIGEAQPYFPPNHFDCEAVRLQGWDASDAKNFWVGLSHIQPNGGTTHEGTAIEKVYVVLSGEVTVITDSGEATLGPLDSCYLAPNEARTVTNSGSAPTSMLVVMPYPPP